MSIIPRLSIELIIIIFFSFFLFFSLRFDVGISDNKEYFSVLVASIIRILPFFIQVLRFQNTLRYSETFVKEIKENIEHLEKFQSNKTSNISSDFNFKKILIKNITFSYEKNLILDDTELDIELNKFVSISGLSGSGKTTLLNIVCGFIEPQNYKIFLMAKNLIQKQNYQI